MASYAARKNKHGDIISYQIKVFRGRDKLSGKQLTPYTMTYTPPVGWSQRSVERELQKVMAEFEAACRRGEVLTREAKAAADSTETEERKKPTFSQYIETFLAEKAVLFSPVTVHNYRFELNKVAAHFGENKLEEVDFLMIKEYFTKLQATATHKYTGKPLKYPSILQHYAVMRSFFENAVENEVIAENPMARMKRPKPRKNEELKQATAYNEGDLRYIIECLDGEPTIWKALVLFAIDSGCRAGEVMGLKWSEIDFDSGRVNICRNVQYTAESGVYVGTPKNHKNRVIFINPPALEALKQWHGEQEAVAAQSGYCFTKCDGSLMRPTYFSVYMRRFGKRYNLPGIHPHALRHAMATVSIANGADIVSVSKKLGHANTSITLNVYTHANEEAQRRANKAFAAAVY